MGKNGVDRLLARLSGQKCSKSRADAGVCPRREGGFSLLEILVAFTLLAVAMGVLMQIFSRGVNGATLADRYAKATMYAESKLASVGVVGELKEGTAAGKFDDDFSWSLAVRPYQDPFPKEATVVDFEKLMPQQAKKYEFRSRSARQFLQCAARAS
ncbi:MAG: prepilin-type N-terminal cleavage/methylation domain-containing protein [Usitatibacteraceae bacterium]